MPRLLGLQERSLEEGSRARRNRILKAKVCTEHQGFEIVRSPGNYDLHARLAYHGNRQFESQHEILMNKQAHSWRAVESTRDLRGSPVYGVVLGPKGFSLVALARC